MMACLQLRLNIYEDLRNIREWEQGSPLKGGSKTRSESTLRLEPALIPLCPICILLTLEMAHQLVEIRLLEDSFVPAIQRRRTMPDSAIRLLRRTGLGGVKDVKCPEPGSPTRATLGGSCICNVLAFLARFARHSSEAGVGTCGGMKTSVCIYRVSI